MKSTALVTLMSEGIAALALGAAATSAADARSLKIQTSSNASHFSLAYLDGNRVPKLNDTCSHGVHVVGCGAYPREALVPKLPINGVADSSAYANNDASGMHKIAKVPLHSGIHSMPILHFSVSQQVWGSLGEADHKALEDRYQQAYTGPTAAATRAEDERLVERDRAAGELTIIDWPQAERDKLRVIAQEAWADFAKQSGLAQETFDAHVAFMKQEGLL